MYKKEQLAIFGVLLVAVIVSSLFYTAPTGMTDSTKVQGTVCAKYESLNGVIDLGCMHNTVTDIAKNQTRDVRMGRTIGNTTWSALMLTTGSTPPAATDTTCEATIFTTNGCGPTNGTTVASVDANVGNYSVTYKFQATGACAAIAKVCLTNNTASTSPLMASALLSSAVTLAANENLTIVYYVGET